MALALGLQKEATHHGSLGPFAGDSSPQSLSRSSYGSISSPPSSEPQKEPLRATYLSEKILIPDTEPVGMLETSWGLSGLAGCYGIPQAGAKGSPEDCGKPLLALSISD